MIREAVAAAILALPGKQDRKIKRLEEENNRLADRIFSREKRIIELEWELEQKDNIR